MIQWMLAIWSLVPLPFLYPALTSGCSWFTYYWRLTWRILSIALLTCEMSAVVQWTFFGTDFFWGWNEPDLFQSCGHCWVFQICWCVECNTLIASSFRIWNTSARIPSSPLPLFIVMLPKGLLAFAFQDVWLLSSDHTTVVIWVMKIFFCIVLLCILATSS